MPLAHPERLQPRSPHARGPSPVQCTVSLCRPARAESETLACTPLPDPSGATWARLFCAAQTTLVARQGHLHEASPCTREDADCCDPASSGANPSRAGTLGKPSAARSCSTSKPDPARRTSAPVQRSAPRKRSSALGRASRLRAPAHGRPHPRGEGGCHKKVHTAPSTPSASLTRHGFSVQNQLKPSTSLAS